MSPQDTNPLLETTDSPASEADVAAIFDGSQEEDALLKAFEEETAINPMQDPDEPKEEASTSEEEPSEEDKPLYSKEELLALFDTLMFDGVYTEVLTVSEGKLTAMYRTRTASESNYINVAVDRQQYSTIVTLQNHQALMTLSYALKEYTVTNSQGKTLTKTLPEKPAEAYESLSSLPEAMVEALCRSMTIFDDKVRMALAEAEANF